MRSALSILAAASTLVLLSACGGSDGGDPTGPQGLAITSTNKDAVARATISGGLAVSNVQAATTTGGSLDQPTGVAGRSHALAALARRALAAGQASRSTIESASAHPAAVSTSKLPCGVSGSITTSFDDRDGNQLLSSGDVLSVQFNQCRDASDSLFNGKAVLTLTSVPSATQISANADFQAVSSVAGGLTSTINGAIAVAETDSDTDSFTSITVGSGAFTATFASTGYNDVVTMGAGLRITVDQQFAASRTSLTYDGSMQAQSVPGGAVTLTTVTPIVQLDADAFPSSGVLKAQGAQGTLLMTVLDATTVQVQLDAGDDGTYESTTTTPWTAFFPS